MEELKRLLGELLERQDPSEDVAILFLVGNIVDAYGQVVHDYCGKSRKEFLWGTWRGDVIRMKEAFFEEIHRKRSNGTMVYITSVDRPSLDTLAVLCDRKENPHVIADALKYYLKKEGRFESRPRSAAIKGMVAALGRVSELERRDAWEITPDGTDGYSRRLERGSAREITPEEPDGDSDPVE